MKPVSRSRQDLFSFTLHPLLSPHRLTTSPFPTLIEPHILPYTFHPTGSRSAICGGTTTIITFAPQSRSSPSLSTDLISTHEKVTGNCYCDYAFHILLSSPTPETLAFFPDLIPKHGISSIKIYMTYSALQLRDNEILSVLLAARHAGLTTMIHAENGDVLNWMTEQLESWWLYAPEYHATSRPQMLETEATNRAISLAGLIATPILIVHVSSPTAAAHIREAQTKGLPVYAETCPQYLYLLRSDLAGDDSDGFSGAKCVCSPPPRSTPEDHSAIWRGLLNGTFTILSSDHCPFQYHSEPAASSTGKKSSITPEHPLGKFSQIPNGIPGLETRLPLTFHPSKLPLQRFVELTSTNPSKLYGLYPQKGALLPGLSDADLTIWYPEGYKFPNKEGDEKGEEEALNIKNENLHHACDYTPFEGRAVPNWPRYTILRGKVVWNRDREDGAGGRVGEKGGGLVGEKGYGRFIKRERSMFGGFGEGKWDVSAF